MAPFCLRGRFSNNKRSKLQCKNKKKKSGMKDMQERFEKLKVEMEEISDEQKNIREGQRQVREKFEAIESECEELKRETRLIIQKSARTQIKLVLMFRILKAREQGDLATAANFTHLLREIVGREDEERQASGDN
ncbi:hypothetical protein QQP08_001138 [Theobroma cacao]|uniref:Uncharacterized protein LOC18611942 n=2 Tax=Theobroma cacao TaxID=3641 RepID=A0AB32WGR1_THECC|nr:PREDICTED: uncharacterized protein LOC18611942 [Theobroma cacao]EOX92673.1 Uncharacterized protein TCM_001585 [Theobroma cacao]WRX08651.1 hypothetical protein QQP08_001138 [Theobroma cacao]